MPDNDADDIERRRTGDEPDENDEGPLLSFDFDEAPMPHWSEPGSSELPDGGERPDPPEIETPSRQGSRLFPQLPDDPHLVDTSDTGLMDVLRSDTVPTISPAGDSELFDTGPVDVEDAVPASDDLSEAVAESNGDEYSQSELSTDELFHESLFEEDAFDASEFDDAPIIGGGTEFEAPLFDTGTINEVVDKSEDGSEFVSVSDDLTGVDSDGSLSQTSTIDAREAATPLDTPVEVSDSGSDANISDIDNASIDEEDIADEPTEELVLEEEDDVSEIESRKSDSLDKPAPSDDSLQTDEEKPLEGEQRQPPRVIELFDTPPSQRAMKRSPLVGGETASNEKNNPAQLEESGEDWAHFGGPAPHWREDRRDYEEPVTVSDDDRVVTHSGNSSERNVSPKRSAGRNLPLAIVVGLALGGAFFALLKVGPWAALCMVVLALAIAVTEFLSSVQNLGYRPATLLGIASVVGLSLGAYHRGYEAYPVVLGLTVLTGICWFLFDVDSEHVTANLAVTLLGVAWVGGLGSFAALILAQSNGDAILIGAVVGTVAYDVGGYVIGSTTGQSKLAPRVSPNKTYEGLLGGMMLAVVVTTLVLNRFPGIHPWSESMMDCLWLGLAIAVVAPIGDLAQSMIKRDMGVKDMGTLLPGHGGVFDRFDALLFVLPTTYFVADLVLG
ncbi:MAG TPA: phosphatidate cytidylyltransferase [Acidimicrobiales bacterium]|nr:phosphatidate cytidylyltransferase [Acidimicrobiales bacterium]|tara:strand:- start:2655 stop:4667 length:2013 start_codon:yes stop_codon:yes gene_type:complete